MHSFQQYSMSKNVQSTQKYTVGIYIIQRYFYSKHVPKKATFLNSYITLYITNSY